MHIAQTRLYYLVITLINKDFKKFDFILIYLINFGNFQLENYLKTTLYEENYKNVFECISRSYQQKISIIYNFSHFYLYNT